jgi:hypothetical protein
MSANTLDPSNAGDPISPEHSVIEVRVPALKGLFNAIDPSAFHDKDLDPAADDFIVSWAKELSRDAPLALRVHLDRSAGLPDEAAALGDVIHKHFARRALAFRRRLRFLFRIGRTSLVIGLAFLTTSIAISDLLEIRLSGSRLATLIRESVLIGGWVAMWRPLEVFLYDWWPILAEARLSDRLATMPVQIRYHSHDATDFSWKQDWPVAMTKESPALQSPAR